MVKCFCCLLLLLTCRFWGMGQLVMDKEELTKEILSALGNWKVTELVPGGRIDAVRVLDDSVIVCGVRGANRGNLFISENYGVTWKFLAKPTDSEITCIAGTGNRSRFYILTGNAEVWGTENGGKSWKKLITLTTNKNTDGAAAAYGILYTARGTLLVTDTDSKGGHVFRSVNKGKSWKDLGVIGKNALYRMEETEKGIIVNGFDGNVYTSTDDGYSWKKLAELSASALFATEYLGDGRLLQADQAGNIYGSNNYGESWQSLARMESSADDFIHLKNGVVYYSTYTGERKIYVSVNEGKNWRSIGGVPVPAANDWLDHGISLETKDSLIAVAGTGKGFIIRNAFSKKWLKEIAGSVDPKETDVAVPVQERIKDTLSISLRNPRIQSNGSKNLIPNASFECGTSGWSSLGKHTGWGGDFWSLYGELDDKQSWEGKRSLRIELGPGKTPVTYFDAWPTERVVQNAPLVANRGWIDVVKGQSYTLSVYMRADKDSVPGALTISQAYDLSIQVNPVKTSKQIMLSKKWARYSYTITALDRQLFVAAGPMLANDNDSATVWVDAFQLEQTEVPTVFSHREPVELGFSTVAFGNIFSAGEKVSIQCNGYNRLKQPVIIPVECTIVDYFDSVIYSAGKNMKIRSSGSEYLDWPLTLPGTGYYYVKYSWKYNGQVQTSSFPLAVIDPYDSQESAFGVNHAPTTEAACRAIQQAGMKWARNWSVNWGLLEPAEGQLSFAISDHQVDREHAVGLNTLALLPPLPSANWNSTAPDSIAPRFWHRMSYMPSNKEALTGFIKTAISYYRDKLKFWEFLNEPVWTSFCLPGKHYRLPGADYYPDDYISLLKLAYPVMKAADSSCTVIGGFSAEPWRYTKDFVAADGLKYVDILNIHNYGMFTPPESFISEMDTLLAYMDQYGMRKPIWITEYSYYAADSLPWTPWKAPAGYSAANLLLKDERQCADWTVRYNTIMFARGVEKIFYHQASEGEVNHSIMNLEFAFLGNEGQPRKAYAAQAAQAAMMGPQFKYAGSFTNQVPDSNKRTHHIQGYAFQCNQKAVMVAWVSEKETSEVYLHIPEGVELYNIMGVKQVSSGKHRLGHSPVYIVADSYSADELLQLSGVTVEKLMDSVK